MIGKLFGWLGRKAVLYAMLVVAIATGTFVVPWIKQVAAVTTATQMRASALSNAEHQIASERETAKRSFLDKAHHLRFESIDKLDERCPALIKERAELAESIGRAESPWVLAIINQTKRLAIERSKLRVAVIDQELSAISAARNAVASDGESIAAQADLAAQQRNVARLFRCVTKPGGTSSNMSSVGVGKCGSGGRAQSTQRWSPRETGNVMRRAHRSRGGTNWSMWRAEMRC